MNHDDDPLPSRWRWGAALTLVVLLLVGGVFFYRASQPCWPWDETGFFAGGTTCDGEQARFNTD